MSNDRNLVEMFLRVATDRGDAPYLWAKIGKEWRKTTWAEARDAVERLARGLIALGVAPGDRVGLVAENRPEWVIADLAIMAAGAISVPAYTTNTVADHAHVLRNTAAKLAIVSTPQLAEKLLPAAAETGVAVVVQLEGAKAADGPPRVLSWADAQALGDPATPLPGLALGLDDLACVIHTSGTGGLPKGVMLTHGNILHNCRGAEDLLVALGIGQDVFLSFLPLSHSYEHSCGLFFATSIGAETWFAEGADALARNLVEARPTIVSCVPRLLEVFHTRVQAGLKSMPPVRRRLFEAALRIGLDRLDGKIGLIDRLIDPVLDKLVRAKVQDRFGGRLKALVSGGAPMNVEIGRFFHALGVPVFQGYGQTESAPFVSCNRPGMVKLDTVGPPIKEVEVKIAEDGEILIRGPNVMKGYWNDPAATANAIRDGWLHTGDVGEIDDRGRIRITDRKKDLIVVSGGDNISPAKVEGAMLLEPEIGQAMVYGDKHPYLVALVVASEALLQGKGGVDPATDPAIRAAIDAAVERANKRLSSLERVRRFAILAEPFSIANGLMTPTMKVRRHLVRQRYQPELDGLYGAK
jgi:long-chain acyl-CoA synthetase